MASLVSALSQVEAIEDWEAGGRLGILQTMAVSLMLICERQEGLWLSSRRR